MASILFDKFNLLRSAVCIILILLIGCKAVFPTIITIKAINKAIAAVAEPSDNNDDEKKAEASSALEKEKEFVGTFYTANTFYISYTIITHTTLYTNNYRSSHFLKISTPPPDFYLQPVV